MLLWAPTLTVGVYVELHMQKGQGGRVFPLDDGSGGGGVAAGVSHAGGGGVLQVPTIGRKQPLLQPGQNKC